MELCGSDVQKCTRLAEENGNSLSLEATIENEAIESQVVGVLFDKSGMSNAQLPKSLAT